MPADLTERAAKALGLAVQLAEQDASTVTLLHVIETVRGLDFDELKPFYHQLEKRARARLARMARRVTGARISQAIVFGRRAEEIVKFAAAHNADLIVLSSHRVRPHMIGRDWGTISYKVSILAQCPVLLVK